MTTIAEENLKTLRKAMRVECGFRETADEPTNITPVGADPVYIGLENLDRDHLTTVLMDLAGDGFANDGRAVPIETDSESYRYGYVSESATKADGTFWTPFGLTIESSTNWGHITVEVMDQRGNVQVFLFEPVWNSGQTTVLLNSFSQNERAYIVGVYLGKAWIWDNSSLLSVNVDLRSVSTEIGGELEASTIEIKAYEPTDYTEIIGQIPKGAPIWYFAGYTEDISELRRFYLSEAVSWNDNVLTVQGQDATMLLDNVEVPVSIVKYWAARDMVSDITDRIKAALDTVTFEENGVAPSIPADYEQTVLFNGAAARSVISQYTGIFRDDDVLRITYVDAGRPTINYSDVPVWTIYADEITDFNITVEKTKNRIEIDLPDYYEQSNDYIETIDAVAGKTYFVDIDPPSRNIGVFPSPTSVTEINPGLIKFKAAETRTYEVYGYQVFEDLQEGNDPFVASSLQRGETYKFGFTLPLFFTTGGVSVTKQIIPTLLDRSNILYEFTYRGNPHIQPRDVLNVEVAAWVDDFKIVDGLYPALDLYPAEDLYPYAVYKKVRKMVKSWVTMTVDSISLEHSEGGLISKVKARKGEV